MNFPRNLVCTLLIFASGLADANHDQYLFKEGDSLTPPAKLSKSQVKQDKDTLLLFLRKGYAGYKYVDQTALKQAEKSIEGMSNPMTPEDMCSTISIAFSKVPDGHLGATIDRSDCLPTEFKNSKRVGSIGSNVSPKFPKDSSKPFRLSFVQQNGRKLPVLGITRFPFYDSSAWEGFEAAVETAKQSDALVIDLRGNSGGDDRRGYQLAGLLLGKPATIDTEKHIERQNPETFVLLLNKLTYLASRQKTNEEKKVYLGLKETWQTRYQKALSGVLDEYSVATKTTHFDREISATPYRGKIYVVADADCGSSGESTLKVLRTLPNAKFVGENTAGVTHFGNQGMLVLPNSRIRISMSTKYIEWANGEFIEKVGISPDIKARKGLDALITVFEQLSNTTQ